MPFGKKSIKFSWKYLLKIHLWTKFKKNVLWVKRLLYYMGCQQTFRYKKKCIICRFFHYSKKKNFLNGNNKQKMLQIWYSSLFTCLQTSCNALHGIHAMDCKKENLYTQIQRFFKFRGFLANAHSSKSFICFHHSNL